MGKTQDDNKYMTKFTREMTYILDFVQVITVPGVKELDLTKVSKMLR